MKKIGICFPSEDFKTMNFEELKEYLLKFKDMGVTSFDFYTSLFLNVNEKLESLVLFLNENGINITFHYQSNSLDFIVNEETYNELLENYQKELSTIHNNLKKLNIDYKIPIVFHVMNYVNASKKYNHMHKLIEMFNVLCEYSKDFNFEILVETLSYNHPKGLHIGDDLSEINVLVNNINQNNFGVCWDIGHTRLNNIEKGSILYLPNKIMNKVKFTHIHNIILNQNDNSYIDHLPLTNMDYQEEELEYLIKNNYQGVYSIEFDTNNLKENILIYLNSIKLIKETLKKIGGKYE